MSKPRASLLLLGLFACAATHASSPRGCAGEFDSKTEMRQFATQQIQLQFQEALKVKNSKALNGSKLSRWLSTTIFSSKLANDCEKANCTEEELKFQVANAFPMIQQLSTKFDLAIKGLPIPIGVSLVTLGLSNYAPLISSNPVYIAVAAIVGIWPFKPVYMMLTGLADQSSFRNHAQTQTVSIASRDGAALETLQGQTNATYTMNSMMSRNGIAQFLIDFSASLERAKGIIRDWSFKQRHTDLPPTNWIQDLTRDQLIEILSDEYATALLGAYSLFREMRPTINDHRFLRARANLNRQTLSEELDPEISRAVAELTLAKVLLHYTNERSEQASLQDHTAAWISVLLP